MKKKLLAIFLSFLFLVGCAPPAPTLSYGKITTIPSTENSSQITEEQLYDMLFDIKNQIHLKLDMSPEELGKMQADYELYDQNGGKSPVYRKADLSVRIITPDNQVYHYTVPEVGVRMKGNTSRTDFYSAQDGIYNLIHLKISFQETFDKAEYYGSSATSRTEEERIARKNRTFATLEKMDLRWNRCDDSTFVREYFAYQSYRYHGVLAPNTNLATLNWAGNHMGIFTINEPIDEVFLSKNLPESALGGDLYKCGWAGYENASFQNTTSIGIEDDEKGLFFAYDLKTNKKTSTHQSLKNLIHILNRNGCTAEEIAEVVDMDNFLTFSAVSYLLGNPDDMRNNYNNFYIYFRADNGKALLIPYDYDRCLGITVHWNPTGDAVTSDDPFSTTLNSGNGQQQNPLILKTIVSDGYYVQEYAEELRSLANSRWFSFENFSACYHIFYDHYHGQTLPDRSYNNTRGLQLTFDLNRTSAFSDNRNISVREYLNAKIATLHNYLDRLPKK